MKVLSFFVFIAIITLPFIAKAERELLVCGAPAETEVETEVTSSYCNIFENQLAYKEVRDALHEQMKQRQESFAAPSLRAQEEYQNKLKQIHENTHSDDE